MTLHIVVGTRSTPDTAARLALAADGSVTWGDSPLVINPWDEYAVEEALLQTQAHGGTVTVMALGPEPHTEALKHAIAMGASAAIRLWDEAWTALDSRGFAAVFAAAVRKLGEVDLVLFGKEAADEATDQHIFQTARQLGWTLLSYVSRIADLNPDARTIRVERLLEEGKLIASGPLPAVLNVMKGINEPRYPSFMGIRKAARAEIPVWDAAALGITAPAPKARVIGIRDLPVREGACTIIEGEGVAEQARLLVDRLMAEKVV